MKIVASMRDNPNVTINQLMMMTGLSAPGIKKNLKQLKDMGEIKRIGANKMAIGRSLNNAGFWEINAVVLDCLSIRNCSWNFAYHFQYLRSSHETDER